jgi:hypothetical protein
MNNKVSLVKVLKNSEAVKSLKEASTSFCIFSSDVVDFTKEIDRPNDYYVEGDKITFTIKLKNVGDKRIVNFSLKDELEEFVLPFEAGYEVSTTIGQIASYNKPVMVNNITLKPEEEAIVTITGLIGAIE